MPSSASLLPLHCPAPTTSQTHHISTMADNTEPSTEDSANADTTDAVNDATTAVSSLSVQDNQAAVVDDVAEETQILVEDVQENDENADELPPHAQIRQEFLSLLPPPPSIPVSLISKPSTNSERNCSSTTWWKERHWNKNIRS